MHNCDVAAADEKVYFYVFVNVQESVVDDGAFTSEIWGETLGFCGAGREQEIVLGGDGRVDGGRNWCKNTNR